MPQPPKTPPGTKTASSARKLGRLLETEGELEAMIAQARVEATAIVEAARHDATVRVRQMEAGLASEAQALGETIDREREATLEALARETERRVALLGGLDEGAIRDLARRILPKLLAEPAEGEAP